MKIGVYGGTFDPPHLGHSKAALAAIEGLELDRLLLIPAAWPPHKALPQAGATAQQRLEMTRLMADGLGLELGAYNRVETLDVELQRQGPSFTVDTLRQLKETYPQDQLYLLMGTDMLASFPTWRDPETIAQLAHLVAFARNPGEESQLSAQAKTLADTLQAQVTILPLEATPLASSQLRERLVQGEGREDVWCQVYGYILRHGRYQTPADLKHLSLADLRCASYSMIRAKRIPHVKGCEEEAVRLAQRWGANPDLARKAAILHDCTKYESMKQHLALCAQYNLPLDDLERRTEKLLHAKTGALLARYIYGMPDEVYEAIYYHTTGKADMSLLSKIVYMADYMEPNRSGFEGLETLRHLAYENLDAAILLGCELTISDMEERGMAVHVDTLAARDFLKGC